MAVVMNMDNYRIEHLEAVLEAYDDEVMNAGWNPQLALAAACELARDPHHPLPPALAECEIEGFLQKMSTCQR